jgi:hypothetical protein
MASLTEFRQKYPQYDDLSDEQLAGALHKKYYSDMPEEEFRAKIDFAPPPAASPAAPAAPVPQGGSWADPFIGQGLLMGFGDEMKAGVRGAARRAFGDNPGKSLSDLYNEELTGTRADLGEFQQRHPVLSPALEVGGAVASIPFIPGGAATKGLGLAERAARAAATGATQGAIYGAGSSDGGLLDRAQGAAQGAATGYVGGLAAPLVVRGAQAGLRAARDYGVAPTTKLMRDALATERGAKARIGNALAADASVSQDRLLPADLATARQHGTPVYNVDLGGVKTRALAQSAGNTSPEGRAVLEKAIGNRFEGQADRTEGALRQIVGGFGAVPARDALEMAAQKENRGNYAWAYGAGDRPIWSTKLEQLTSSDAVKDAMRDAVTRGKDRAASEGFGGFNPGVTFDPSGLLTFKRGPAGIPTYPNIQYWDYVQRALRGRIGTAKKAGNDDLVDALTGLRNSLNAELDKQVPEFGNARRGAARFFGADSALEAGQKFGSAGPMHPDLARKALAKFSPAERQLFAEGWTDSVVQRVKAKGYSQDVIRQVFESPGMKERMQIALGPGRARELEAFLRVENLADEARNTVSGFSTTARQQVELGMAGGIGGGLAGYSYGGGDWKTAGVTAAIAGFLLRRGGARVNQKVAQRVAEMLASKDPAVIKQGVQIVANNDRWMDALRHLDRPLGVGASMTAQKNIPVINLNVSERDKYMQQRGSR